MNEININEIVKVESLGVIKQQLDKVEELIDEKVKDIPNQLEKIKKMSFTEQEEEKGDIKKYQQYLSNIQKQLEDKRKEIKKEINKPYEEFEEYYKNGVYEKLNDGINQLKEVVNNIEDLQKDEKKCELELFTKEYIEFNHLETIISFDDIPINITLSASIKSLKDQILTFIKKVSDDLECMSSDENKDEILYEYQHNGFDYAKAVLTIRKRKEEIKRMQEQQKEIQMQVIEENKNVSKVESALFKLNDDTGKYELLTPKEIIEDEDIIEVSFKVKGTKEQIKQIKNLIIELGVEYE